MNATLSKTAWVLHDLGLATSVGGALFGKAGLHPALRVLPDQRERGEVTQEAWRRFSPINLGSHAAVVLTWLVGRSFLSGRAVSRQARGLVIAKDVLIGVYLTTGLAAVAAGYQTLHAQGDGAPPLEAGGGPAPSASRKASLLQRASTNAGTINLAAGVGLIVVTTFLAMQSGRSAKWSFLSRLLP